MARKLKILGFGLLAIAAMSATAVSNASAHYVFTSAITPTDLTGEQIEGLHKFTIGGQSVECTTATFTGTQTGTEASELAITPTYANCTYGTKTIDMTMNGCTYTFTGETQVSGHGIMHIRCPTVGGVKQKIEFHMTNFSGTETCTQTIAEQTPGQGFTEATTGKDVKLTTTISGIVVATDGAALACKALAVSNATWSGVTTMRGYKDGLAHNEANQVAISVDS